MREAMKRPPHDQFVIAIEWLRNNEGEGIERESCSNVAAYLEHLSEEHMIKTAARKAGLPPAALRRKLQENRNERS